MIVFTNGCFDTLHAGHVQMLQYCRYLAQGDPVYVAIDSDARVLQNKGLGRPYFDQRERFKLLMNLTTNGILERGKLNSLLIDWVYIFDSDEKLYSIIKHLKPDYIVKGDEWRDKPVIGSDIAPVIFLPAYFKDLSSTTEFENRILKRNSVIDGTQKSSSLCSPIEETKKFWSSLYRRRN